jgi:serine/threonine-protein kinase
MAESAVSAGHVLVGRYRLETQLGHGGMGTIWRAQHLVLNAPVAVKVIDRTAIPDEETLSRFMREAQSAAALRSPHVVQILDYGTDRGVPYIAMELLEGESLATRLERVGRLPPPEVGRIITEIARAIGKAHELSIVHRDLKPDNVYLCRNDEAEVTKVLDFGIAKATQGFGVASSSETRTGAILGTPHYMSPEQAEGTKLVDHRTDIWALGVIAFECLVGRRPFDSDALGSLLLAICTRPLPVPSAWGFMLPGFDAWFAKACARELGERFQSARELASELRRVTGSAEARDTGATDDSRGAFAATALMQTPYVAVPPTAGALPAPPPPQKKPPILALMLGAFAALVLVASAGVVLVRQRTTGAAAEPPTPTAAPLLPTAAPVELAPLATASAQAAPAVSASAAAPPLVVAAPVASQRPLATGAASFKAPTRPRAPARKTETPATSPAPPPAQATSTAGKVNLGI